MLGGRGRRCAASRPRGSPWRPSTTVAAGEAELLEEHRAGRAGAVVADADDPAGVADDVPPARADAGFDADPGQDVRRDDRVAVGLILLVEPLPAGHRDHPGGDAVGGQLFLGRDGVLHLGSGADQDHVGGALGVLQHVRALGHPGGVGESVLAARHDGQVLPAEDEPGRPVLVLQDRRPGRRRSRWRRRAGPRRGRGWCAAPRHARSAGGWGRPRRARWSRGSRRRSPAPASARTTGPHRACSR